MLQLSPNSLQASGAFLCLYLIAQSVSAYPVATRDHNPFKLIQGLPLPVSATLPAVGERQWSLGMDITNTLNFENTGQESLVLDYETHQLNIGYSIGLSQGWALKLDIPLIHRGGGVLDSGIDTWHRMLGLPRANRPFVANNQFQISYIDNGVTQSNLISSTQGIGDIQLALGYQIKQDAESSLSAWITADLPAGDKTKLTGNEALDIAFMLATSTPLDKDWTFYGNLGSLFPGDDKLVTTAVESNIWFGHAGLKWSEYESFDVLLQLNAHSRFYQDSGIRMLGNSHVLILGGSIHLDCSELELAISEDIKVEASPDVSFLVNWRRNIGDCSQNK